MIINTPPPPPQEEVGCGGEVEWNLSGVDISAKKEGKIRKEARDDEFVLPYSSAVSVFSSVYKLMGEERGESWWRMSYPNIELVLRPTAMTTTSLFFLFILSHPFLWNVQKGNVWRDDNTSNISGGAAVLGALWVFFLLLPKKKLFFLLVLKRLGRCHRSLLCVWLRGKLLRFQMRRVLTARITLSSWECVVWVCACSINEFNLRKIRY